LNCSFTVKEDITVFPVKHGKETFMKNKSSEVMAKKARKRSFRDIIYHENTVGYVFISLFIVGFLVFTVYPLLSSLYLSFTKYSGLGTPEWIGLLNYKRMFTMDPRYIKSLKVTFVYVFIYVPLRLIFALLVAMLFKGGGRIIAAYRTIYYLPSVIGGSVAVAVIWRQLWGYGGIMNQLMIKLGLMEEQFSFIASKDTALMTIIVLAVWQFGSPMLVFLAGLKDIPASLYEAATVDGANNWQKFWKITLPSLTPIIFFNLVNQLISGFMAFTQAYIITRGGPNDATMLYVVYLYEKSFTTFQMGYGSAMAWVLIVIVAILTAILFATQDKWVYYENK
jgi:multiple sugar transport system permease protein